MCRIFRRPTGLVSLAALASALWFGTGPAGGVPTARAAHQGGHPSGQPAGRDHAGSHLAAATGGTERIDGLDSLASATLLRALDYMEVRPEELGFDKLWADDDTFRLGLVEEILGDPLKLPRWQSETVESIRAQTRGPDDLPGLAGLLGTIIEAPPRAATPAGSAVPDARAATSKHARGARAADDPPPPAAGTDPGANAVAGFIDGCRQAESALQRAFAGLSEEDRTRILMLAPAFWGSSDDPEDTGDRAAKGALHREFGLQVDTTLKVTEDPILDAAVKLDRGALTRATQLYMEALTSLLRNLPQSSPGNEITLPGVIGPVTASYDTPWGRLVIGGPGPNTYTAEAWKDIAFLIDPGGDDVYRGRPASAVGGLGHTMSAVVDLAGDDLYESQGRSYAPAGAVLGLAALIDLQGDDVYRGEDGSCGAGFFGSGILYDGGGRDFFEGRNLSEGAGAFGIGALLSQAPAAAPPGPALEEDLGYKEGLIKVPGTGAIPVRYDDNDVYVAARQSQGFASTFGIGLLYDRTGNDTYRTGGRYLHRPLLPHDFQSLSQGFSIGFRPRAGGGVGILMDEEGNDFYDAEVYSQGASYWYSMGLLYDGQGNDRYLATQYSQGAGIHLSIGSIWDRGGDDHYTCKLGVTQGTGHDLSVGMQLDEGGNDFYIVSDGQGVSITNSVGIFIDEQGNDVYSTPGVGQGALTWTRGFCGAAVFLDLEGKDTYPPGAPGTNGAVWSPGLYAVGVDLDRDIKLPEESVPEPVLTAADSARTVKELFETASIWDVGSAREKVARAGKALLTKGIEAADYAAREKLDSQDGLVYRVLLDIGKAMPDSFTARILPRLHDPDRYVQRNVISLLGEMKRTDARAPMEAMLKDPRQEQHWNRLIQALGNIGDRAAIPALRPFLGDAMERRRIVSTVALSALKDTVSLPVLAGLLEDPLLTVRSAASAGLVSFGAVAAGPIEARLPWAPPAAAGGTRAGASAQSSLEVHLRTLGSIAAAIPDTAGEAGLAARSGARLTLMNALTGLLGTDRAPERAAAVEGLLRLGDPETVEFVKLRVRDEYDPLVLRTYRKGLEENGKKPAAG